jgi:hypothetical protein
VIIFIRFQVRSSTPPFTRRPESKHREQLTTVRSGLMDGNQSFVTIDSQKHLLVPDGFGSAQARVESFSHLELANIDEIVNPNQQHS